MDLGQGSIWTCYNRMWCNKIKTPNEGLYTSLLWTHRHMHTCGACEKPRCGKTQLSSQSARQWDVTEFSQTWWAETCQSCLLAHQRLSPTHTRAVQTAANTPACFTEASTNVNISAQADLTWITHWNYHGDWFLIQQWRCHKNIVASFALTVTFRYFLTQRPIQKVKTMVYALLDLAKMSISIFNGPHTCCRL